MLPKFINNLKLLATRPETVQRDELASVVWNVPLLTMGVEGGRSVYVDSKEIENLYQKTIKKIFGTKQWKKHFSDYKQLSLKMANYGRLIKKQVPKASNKQLLKILFKFNDF